LSDGARIIFLGGGSVVSEFYLPALQQRGHLAEVRVIEPAAVSREAITAAFPLVEITGEDYADVLASLPTKAGAHECVVVALPNPLHVDGVARAVSVGRHVLCEKPLALTAADCERLVRRAKEQGVLLKVAMSRRYLPTLLLARQIVLGGELGAVRSIEVLDRAPFLWRPRSLAFFAPESGGVLADMGVHYLDYIETLVGPLMPVAYEDDSRGGTESSCSYSLTAGDVGVRLCLSRVAHSGTYLRIACDRGEVRVEKTNETELTVATRNAGARRVSLEQPFENAAWPRNLSGSFCQMLADFEREMDGMPTMIADARDALRVASLIEWAYRHRPARDPQIVSVDQRSRSLVTGATGFIGGHLVERLTGSGEMVRAAVRSPGSCANIARFPVEMQLTELLDMASVRRAVEGAHTVYHLAYGKEGDSAPAITIDGTKNVMRAAIEAGVHSVVVLSTMYVLGLPEGSEPVDETFPYRPYGGEYAKSKMAMERWCLAQAGSSGRTRIAILNPTCVFGPGGGAYTALPVDLARTGRFCWINGGSGLANYTYVDNTVDAIIQAGRVEAAHGQRFIVNDGTVTWRDLIEPMLRPLGRSIPSYTPEEFAALPHFGGPFRLKELLSAALSAPEVRAVAKRSARARRVFKFSQQLGPTVARRAPPVLPAGTAQDPPPDWLATLFPPARSTFSARKAREILGWVPRVTLAEAHAATISWLIKIGRLRELVGAVTED
jgi:predicted dehydrogenase/nucleoside-diphosphate-sugar epimerase